MIVKGPVRLMSGDVWMLDMEIDDLPEWFTPQFYGRLNGEPGYTKPYQVNFDGELELVKGQ